jgi:hypothetical protein
MKYFRTITKEMSPPPKTTPHAVLARHRSGQNEKTNSLQQPTDPKKGTKQRKMKT